MLRIAGCPDEVIAAVRDVISKCRVCRAWELPESKPIVKGELVFKVNDTVHADLMFYRRFGAAEDDVLIIFHMLDEASRWRMVEKVMGRTFVHFKDAICRWIGIFGPPRVFKIDRETGFNVREMQVWLEGKKTRLDPFPVATGGTSGSHTKAGLIESHNRVLRRVLHRLETAARAMGLELTDTELLQEAQWCCNAVPHRDGVTASQGALGHLPRDPLSTENLTGTQASDPRSHYLERARLRSVGIAATMEAITEERIARAIAHRTRGGTAEEEGPVKYSVDQEVEVCNDPHSKDLPIWRGPARVVAVNRQQEGRITVEWQGSVSEVPLHEVRPYWPDSFFAGAAGGALVSLCQNVDRNGEYVLILGIIPTASGDILSKSCQENLEMFEATQDAAKELGWTIHGTILGQGVSKIPPIRGRQGVGVFMWWSTGFWSSMKHAVVQSHWPLQISKFSDDTANTSFVLFYTFDLNGTIVVNDPSSPERGHGRVQQVPLPLGSAQASNSGGSSSSYPYLPPVPSVGTSTPAAATAANSTNQRVSWRNLQGRWLRGMVDAARVLGDTLLREGGETAGENIGESIGQTIGRALGGSAGENVGGAIGQQIGGRLGEQVAQAAAAAGSGEANSSSSASSSSLGPSSAPALPDPAPATTPDPAPAATNTGGRSCGVMCTWLQRLEYEMEYEVPNERGPQSVKVIYLSKLKKQRDDDELTPDEEVMFWKELNDAKRAELRSWVEHGTFSICFRKECKVKPQSSRWVNRWKRVLVPGPVVAHRWVIKSRLCPRGYGDCQGQEIHTRSPTAHRTAQRLLVSTSSIMYWDLESIDISTAFLQGDPLSSTSTKEGRERVAYMVPPGDAWDLLPDDMKAQFPEHGSWKDWAWELWKSVYGLKDAPLMWITHFFRWILNDLAVKIELDNGSTEVQKFFRSMWDESTFYLRDSSNKLWAMLTVHVDDAGIGSTQKVIVQVVQQAEARFGSVKRQGAPYWLHVGFDYERCSDGSYMTSQTTFIAAQKKEPVRARLTDKLGDDGKTALKSICGTLQYALQSRPEKCGKLAAVQEKMAGDEGTWSAVREGNVILEELQANNDSCKFWYPHMGAAPPTSGKCTSLALYMLSDSAFKNMSDKKSQGGYVLMLVMREQGKVGGYVHILEFASRRSRRVAKSTWSAELHSFVVGTERLERLHSWLREIYQGPNSSRGLDRLHQEETVFLDCYGLVDCRGLWESLTAPVVGSLLDSSMQVYVLAAREAFEMGPLNCIGWIPTQDMLSDALTKHMEDHLWERVYSTGRWYPSEAVLCTRDGEKRKVETLRAFLEYWTGRAAESAGEEYFQDDLALLTGLMRICVLASRLVSETGMKHQGSQQGRGAE